ncbi:hypothetical protein Misp01_01430 [Microtetraspora sp. NBRC 13810]|uniref:hypothetical protein n=1 Tax=Microtetraspora sp. NBRC 13810 TaxID=3030990 RepID=UPI0024A1FFC2|nr:hypothetical protein [Microtetraspora sp. NBRC 13810]GLW05013.1 hypothetical protein Misp01_01430 [Microtetraspora sp. NBRC 13810]
MLGVLFSSPSDIRTAAESSRALNEMLDEVAVFVQEIEKLPESFWRELGRTEFAAVAKKFTSELGDNKRINDAMGGALDCLALLSFVAAIVGVIGAGVLLKCAIGAMSAAVVPGGAIPAATFKSVVTEAFRGTLKTITGKNVKSFAMAAGIVTTGGMLLAQLLKGRLDDSASPTGERVPDFKQVLIGNLPTGDDKGSFYGQETDRAKEEKA